VSVFVHGLGAVSAAGWSVDSMRDALAKGEPLPATSLTQPGLGHPLRVRTVPVPCPRQPWLSHARLRRTSAVSQFTVSACLEALGDDALNVQQGGLRLGIVLCVMTGCVNYSRRFYAETLHDPQTASPLLFPETVFNAPMSHVAALLGSEAISCALVGDPGTFLVGLALGAQWLRTSRVDACLVAGAEEADPMVADAVCRFARGTILSAGAGALYLGLKPRDRFGIHLNTITDAQSYTADSTRDQAIAAVRKQLPRPGPDELLCDGVQGLAKVDAVELRAWSDWRGSRLSPKTVLGEGLAAGSAWQCVAALDALRQGHHAAATVSVVGCNQQAIAARFVAPGK
jgi:hypothetical protein